jgi:hypothetical protein
MLASLHELGIYFVYLENISSEIVYRTREVLYLEELPHPPHPWTNFKIRKMM